MPRVLSVALLSAVIFFSGCDKDDPAPVNEEEVITTLEVTLVPEGGGASVTLKFFDADGEQGSTAPVLTISDALQASTVYSSIIELKNETVNPAGNISEEIAEEADDHLFCFDSSADNISFQYEDQDSNGLPLGLLTTWTTGTPGGTTVTIRLRHQPATKTGQCPGSGETDVEVSFDLVVE